jgi:hypothetical protein
MKPTTQLQPLGSKVLKDLQGLDYVGCVHSRGQTTKEMHLCIHAIRMYTTCT